MVDIFFIRAPRHHRPARSRWTISTATAVAITTYPDGQGCGCTPKECALDTGHGTGLPALLPNDWFATDRAEHPLDPPGGDRPVVDGRLSMGAGPRHLRLPVQWPRGNSTPLSYAAVHKQISRLVKTVRLWDIASQQIQLADWHLQILEDATLRWIRHGTATLLSLEFATRQLGHSSAGQTATYIAEQSDAHRHKLATLTAAADPSD